MDKSLYNKNTILEKIFSSKSWVSPTKKNTEMIDNIYETYYNELIDYEYIQSINDLNHTVREGGMIRYFTYDGDIRYGGFILKKIFIKKNDINDCIILIKNSKGGKWKIHFNNYIIFYKKQKTRNSDIRNLFISYLPESAQEDCDI